MPTDQNSTQYANQIAIPPVIMEAGVNYGKLRVSQFNFTQDTEGSAASVARLYRLPAGKVTLYCGQSQIKTSAFGASRVLDIGYAQYIDQGGDTVAASAAAINNDIDVSGAATTVPGAALADGTITFTSRAGVVLMATVAGGTIPDDATIQGTWVYAVE